MFTHVHICNNMFPFLLCIIENDRKNNIEVLKASKASNKIEINRLREENKENRQKLAALLRVNLLE